MIPIRELLDSSYQGVKRLFVLAYDNTEGGNQVIVGSFKKHFLPTVKLENYNIEIDGRIFMISQLKTQLSNTTKSEKYEEGKAIIIRQIINQIFLIPRKITD